MVDRSVVVDTDKSPHAKLRPVPLRAVRLCDHFWRPRLNALQEVTLPAQYALMEQTGRLDNFRRVAGKVGGGFRGLYFNDSDVYKWRLFLLTGEGRFADVLELVLFNGALSGIGLDGKSYFYVNPLADRGHHRRQPFFECACCPPNITRLLAMVPGLLYALGDDGVFVPLYAASEAELTLNGTTVRLHQRTDYPWDGEVALRIEPTQPTSFTLHLRVPSWCQRATVTVNGTERGERAGGDWLALRREWRRGDTVYLSLPMVPEFIACHPFVEANGRRVALRRGPLVYCLEQTDNPDADVWFIAAETDAPLTAEPLQIGEQSLIALQGTGVAVEPSAWVNKLYQPLRHLTVKPVRFTAIPYFAWANRTAGPMTVWLPG